MPISKDNIYTFLFTWIRGELGTYLGGRIIMANQKAPRPARPYASLNFLNPSAKLGISIDQQTVTDGALTVSTEGMRQSTASINIFGPGAVDAMAKLRDSLDRPDIVSNFAIAQIVHLDDSPINDLTELEETEYEERAQMDLSVGFVATSEVDVGTIDHVSMNGTVNNKNIPVST